MNNFVVAKKDSLRIVGFKTQLTGSKHIHSDAFSGQKTEFFKSIIQEGKMAQLKPISESKLGYGAVKKDGDHVFYYAGVRTSQPAIEGAEEVTFPAGDYLILTGKGGMSRLAFDKLEEQAFQDILNEKSDIEYSGGPIAEILLNGNPTDAEVALWVPIKQKF